MTRAISPPFFEIGPKTFLGRTALLEVVEAASAASVRFDVAVIVTPPALDIEVLKRAAPNLWFFAQSMDTARPGASTGAIVPEALASVGADGVMLNHAERPLEDRRVSVAIQRAQEAGLLTLVCAENAEQATFYAASGADMILLEPHSLIGTAHERVRPWISHVNNAVAKVDPTVLVMHSGGISDERDVHAVMTQGATGTGCTTAIVHACDRRSMTTRMIRAVREGWDHARTDEVERGLVHDD